MLPNFLVIGGSRCGTTYLRKNLHSHPDVFLLPPQEIYASGDAHFFDLSNEEGYANNQKGLDWYANLFRGVADEFAVGEKTGSYLADPRAASCIAESLGPHTRLIALLRDPIHRAHSSYWYHRIRFFPKSSFRDALRSPQGETLLINPGFYHYHLKRYLNFFPRSNIHIALSEDLFVNPLAELQGICNFLGVKPEKLPPPQKERANQAVTSGAGYTLEIFGHTLKNRYPQLFQTLKSVPGAGIAKSIVARSRGHGNGRSPRLSDNQYPTMDDEDREHLRALYSRDVDQLGELLGRDVARAWWNGSESMMS